MTKSQRCVQIEIIDDSLAEDWEVFTVLLSTNSSGVNLTRHKFDVFIQSSGGKQEVTCIIISFLSLYLLPHVVKPNSL